MNIDRIISIQNGADKSLPARCARAALLPPGIAYTAIIKMRNIMFDWQIRSSKHLPKPAISIGNITTGGTGKTPMAMEIVKRLRKMGKTPAVLLRGYKSVNAISDEAALIKDSAGENVPVVCNSNRLTAGDLALKQNPDIDIFVLDDCFQRRQVHRDLDIILIDATVPFGFDYMLPRGMLREPISSLTRANGVIVTRADQVSEQALKAIDNKIKKITGNLPLAHIAFSWTIFLDENNKKIAIDNLQDKNVTGICAIGNPAAFFNSLEDNAKSVISKTALPDHSVPSEQELLSLLKRDTKNGAKAIVTTEKDWVKWREILDNNKLSTLQIPILRPRVSPIFLDGQEALDKLLMSY